MKREIYAVDSNGFIERALLGTFDEYGNLMSHNEDFVTVPLPQPLLFYKPKWNGTEWVEGESQAEREERESLQLLESMKPSSEDLADADLEIKMITLLMEMEVI